jgi:hypothetical protein
MGSSFDDVTPTLGSARWPGSGPKVPGWGCQSTRAPLCEAPEIFPVNYVVAHGTVVFRTAAGLKHVSARLNRLVTLEADGVDLEKGVAWSVVVKSRVTT